MWNNNEALGMEIKLSHTMCSTESMVAKTHLNDTLDVSKHVETLIARQVRKACECMDHCISITSCTADVQRPL